MITMFFDEARNMQNDDDAVVFLVYFENIVVTISSSKTH